MDDLDEDDLKFLADDTAGHRHGLFGCALMASNTVADGKRMSYAVDGLTGEVGGDV